MDQPKRFTDLWNGFDATYTLLTQGRHDLKALKAFLEERATIEDTYHKSLLKLAQKAPFEAKGSLGKCWTELKDSSVTIAKQHSGFGITLVKEVGVALEKAIVHIKKEKTNMFKEHDKIKSELQKRTADHTKCRARYEDAVKQAETAVINRDAGRKESIAPKDLKSWEEKVKSGLKEVERSHAAYEQAVEALKDTQVRYDQKLVEHLQRFEELERERLHVLQEQFNRIALAHESLKSNLEQIVNILNKGVQDLTPDQDIQEFIREHLPNSNPPPHVTFQPVPSEILNHARGDSTTSLPAKAASPMVQQPAAAKAPPPLVNPESKATLRDYNNVVPNRRPSSAAGGGDKFVVALYDFAPDEPSDLPFKQGDRIRLVDSTDENWWKGELNGKVGTFPATYVEPAAAAAGGGAPDAPKVMEGKCEALYDFQAQSQDELSFKQGDILYVTGELNGWYLGKTQDGSRVGIFPSNYVTML